MFARLPSCPVARLLNGKLCAAQRDRIEYLASGICHKRRQLLLRLSKQQIEMRTESQIHLTMENLLRIENEAIFLQLEQKKSKKIVRVCSVERLTNGWQFVVDSDTISSAKQIANS